MHHPWLSALAGRFVVFDGPDGCGKSTQLALVADAAEHAGVHVCKVREPGGTKPGEAIRAVLLDREQDDMTLRTEMLLYMASRAQLCERVIAPALAAGHAVLADRFLSSTLAYQGAAGGLDPADIRAVANVATAGVEPDLTIILDVSERTAAARLGGSGPASLFADRMEAKGEAYRRKVRDGYRALAKHPRAALVDAAQEPEAVFAAVLAVLRDRFAGPPHQP